MLEYLKLLIDMNRCFVILKLNRNFNKITIYYELRFFLFGSWIYYIIHVYIFSAITVLLNITRLQSFGFDTSPMSKEQIETLK